VSSVVKAVALSTLAVLGALALCEFILMNAAPVYTTGIQDAYEYDSILGVRLRKSIDLERITDHREEIHSNKLGTANYQDDFAGYPTRIFAVGDSYTQGTGLPPDQSYPSQLDLLLNQSGSHYEKRFAVVNLGLAAYGGEQSLIVLDRFNSVLGAPSVCLYLGSDNDFDDDLLFKVGARHSHLLRGSPRWGRSAPFLIWLGNRQIVLRAKILWSQRRLERLRTKAMNSTPVQERATQAKTIAELEWPVIARIVNRCKAEGAQVILGWSKLPTASGSYAWLASRAAAAAIPFNDWYTRVDAVSKAIPGLPVVNDHSGGHYRGWVNAEIARGFASIIDSLASESSNRSKSPR
jgi:hypothetical protein